MSALLSLAEAQARLLELAPRMGTESVPVEEALGRVLASKLKAQRTQPPADLSAMDGYAIAGDGPWMVVGESRAGKPFDGMIVEGEATRISTGAWMPDGAQSVLIQENAEVNGATLALAQGETLPEAGRHVRRAGFDFGMGDKVLSARKLIGPAQIALALAAGHATLPVSKRPRVAVLDSGDELAANPAECGPDQIPASNGAMLAAMLAPLVGKVERLGPVADDMGALAAALERAEDCDILVTSGGASVGDHDLVQSALRDWDAELAFWKVAIKPGKPLMVARRGKTVVLGLPGNPVSSFVTGFLFAMPLVRLSLGMGECFPRARTAIAAGAMPAVGSRHEFIRGQLQEHSAAPLASKDSSALRELALANCLIDRPPHSPAIEAGDEIRVYPLENG